jgi:PilZ domain
MEDERRHSPRLSLDVPVRVETRELACAGVLRSLSRTGAVLEIPQAVAVGMALFLAIGPEGAPPLELRAQVVRVEAKDGAFAVAVMFGVLLPQAHARIAALLESAV